MAITKWIFHPHVFGLLFFLLSLSIFFVVLLYKTLKKLSYQLALTQLENAEQIFKQNQEFQTILDSSPVLILYKDIEDKIIKVNKSFTKFFGKSKNDIENKFCFDIFPQYAKKWQEDDKEIIASGSAKRNIIEKFELPNGTRILQTDKWPVKDEKGKVIGIIYISADITEKKKISESIKNERQKLRILFDNVFDAIFLETLNGDIIDCNIAAEKLLGYTRDEILRLKTENFVPPEVAEILPQIVNTIKSGREFSGESLNITKKGEKIPVEVSVKLVKIGDEEFAFTVIRNISQKKAFEQALIESEKKYRELAENSHDFIMTIDENGKILYINEFAAKQFAKNSTDIIGHNLKDVFQDETSEVFLKNISEVFKTKQSIYVRNQAKFPYKKLWLGTWFIPNKDETQQNVKNVLCISRDITDLKIAEDILKESEEVYRTVISNQPDAVLICQNDRIVFANDYSMQKYGYLLEDMIEQNILNFVDVQYKEKMKEFIKTIESGKQAREYEIEILKKDGAKVPVLIKGTRINYLGQDANLIMLMDITEKKKAEEKIVQLNQFLIEEKEKERKASIAKSNFIANMSHEFRTPIAAIISAIDLLCESKLDDKQKRFAESIKYASENLLSLINSILDLSKIESGEIDLYVKKFSLRALVQSTTKMLEYYAREKHNLISLQIDDFVEDIIATDPLRLKEILVNIIGNAIKFTDNGEIEIKVEYFQNRKNVLLFSVKDTGIGIEQKQKEKIFEKFTSGNENFSYEHKFSGSGLGLSISKQLIELLGGTIWLDSDVGKGTTFYFTIKIRDLSEVDEFFDEDTSAIYGKEPINLNFPRKIKVLLVEDSETLRFLFNEYFISEENIELDCAEDGEKAIELFKKNDYDIVLMDLKIPKINGFEATKLIRQIEKQNNKHTPVIVISAFGMSEEISKALESGCDEHLTKPIKKKDLLRIISKFANI